MREKHRLQRRSESARWLAVVVLALSVVGGRAQERGYTIQVASVTTIEEARGWLDELKRRGIAGYTVRVEVPGFGIRYRIRYGRFRTAALAKAAAEREVGRGSYRDFIISREEGGADPARRVQPAGTTEATEPAEAPRAVPGAPVRKPAVVSPETPAPAKPESPVAAVTGAAAGRGAGSEPLLARMPERTRRRRSALPAVPELLGAELSGGRSRWEAIVPDSLPAEKWRAIQFIDQLTGWVGSETGRLFQTNDGGRTWREAALGNDAGVAAIDFLDWNRGWVLTGPGSGAEARLFVTWNGGRSWKQARLAGVEKIYRVDAARGWAIGSESGLWRTVDGGENWLPVETPARAPRGERGRRWLVDLDVSQPDGQTLWLAYNMVEGEGPEVSWPGAIWKSDDGGRRWSEAPLPAELRDQTGRRRLGRFLSVRFFSNLEGLLTGELVDNGQRRWFTLETMDGGETWRLALQSGRELERARFVAPAASIPGRSDSMAGTERDERQSGQQPGQKLGQKLGWSQTATIEADSGGGASHVESHLLVTSDGGRTWSEEFRLLGRHNLVASFRRPGEGWVMTEEGVLLIGRPPTAAAGR